MEISHGADPNQEEFVQPLAGFIFNATHPTGKIDCLEFQFDKPEKHHGSKRWSGTVWEYGFDEMSFVEVKQNSRDKTLRVMQQAVIERLEERQEAGWKIFWGWSGQAVDIERLFTNWDAFKGLRR